jgi:hypothetical protein
VDALLVPCAKESAECSILSMCLRRFDVSAETGKPSRLHREGRPKRKHPHPLVIEGNESAMKQCPPTPRQSTTDLETPAPKTVPAPAEVAWWWRIEFKAWFCRLFIEHKMYKRR